MADLKVLLGVDIDPTVAQIEKDLKKIKPQLDGKLKIALKLDLGSIDKQIGSITTKINKINIDKNSISNSYRLATEELKKLYDLKQRYLKLADPSSDAGNYYKQQIAQQESNYTKAIPQGDNYNAEQANKLTLLRIDLENKLELQMHKTAQAIINKDKDEIDAANKILEVEQKKLDLASKSNTDSQDYLQAEKVSQQVDILQSRIDRAKVSWSKMLDNSDVMAQIEKIEDGLTKVGGDSASYQALNREWQLLSNNIAIAGDNQKNFGDRVTETGSKLAAYLVNMMTYTLVVSNLRSAVQAVMELDSSLVEIRKVTDLSGDALVQFTDKAFEAASQIGRTGKDLIDATAEFVRAGYELENAFELGQASLIMTNIGDGIRPVEDASSALIAVLRGFNISDSNVMEVVDAINEVSNTAPITFRDLTEGMRRVSGTLSQTGTDINETMGLLTVGFAQLRDIEGVSSGKQKAQYVQKCA